MSTDQLTSMFGLGAAFTENPCPKASERTARWAAALLACAGHVLVLCVLLTFTKSEPVPAPVMVSVTIPMASSMPTPTTTDSLVERPVKASHKPNAPVASPGQTSKEPAVSAVAQPQASTGQTSVSNDSASAIIAPRYQAAYLNNPQPTYPIMSRKLREEGMVRLRVLVNDQGRAEKLTVLASSGHVRLDMSARETVQNWTFIPARQAGRNVVGWVEVPIRFAMEK